LRFARLRHRAAVNISYAAVFEEEGALDKFEAFASENGPRFYGLPLNEERIILERTDVVVPELLALEGLDVVPFHAGETLRWRLKVRIRT